MAKYDLAVEVYHKVILAAYTDNPLLSDTKLAKLILISYPDLPVKEGFLRMVIGSWKKRGHAPSTDELPKLVGDVKNLPPKPKPVAERKGLETRGEYIVVNWSSNTIVTDLGQYGSYVASFDRHSLIQRMYVNAYGNETAAIVAMEFDFPHTKAVYVYAKHHGFTKSSPPQTDLEFELGKTVDESVEENIQTMKRRVYKKTQKREWKETQDAAERWWNLENTVIESIQATVAEMQEYKPEQLGLITIPSDYKFSSLIGISDIHYMKLCYDHKGEMTYNREIALARVKDHVRKLAIETSRYGVPERFYVIIGNDNIHVDGLKHETTHGTSQAQATDGLWRLELKNYIKMQFDMIEYYRQIAPVTLIPVKGNHDYETSIALQAFAELYFDKYDDVEVLVCHDARAYVQYGKVCLVVTHGNELRSVANLENQAHKLIMGEAKNQGINVMDVDYYIVVHGHEHVGSTRDLNGGVQRIGLSSMSDIDDFWHKESGYVGRQNESQVVIIDSEYGRKAILYA